MSIAPRTSEFFIAGGTLRPNTPSYVERQADEELFELVNAGEFCYVLTSRQMGKSSLMIRTARRLQKIGARTAIIDLTEIGLATIDQWYLGLISELSRALRLSVDPEAWWHERASFSQVQRFSNFLRDVLLNEVEEQISIFIDEIDTTLNLDFRDDFFAAIRAMYNNRARDQKYNRLTFIFLGVASPVDLIKDHSRTPFNIGQEIKLKDFGKTDAGVLQSGLEMVHPGLGETIFNRIHYWTNGHPYLTQKLCQAIAKTEDRHWDDQEIDNLVEKLFLSEEASKETNLQFVQDSINENPQKRKLLILYRQVYEGDEIADDERSLEQNQLKLSGLVKSEDTTLKIRNEIYQRVFDLKWVKANLPIEVAASDFFIVGGTVASDSPSYIKRPADDELFELALAAKPCYVLTARQMGKSSLMIRTARRLEQQDVHTAIIDLTRIGIVTVDQWYFNILTELKEALNLSVDLENWWQEQSQLGPVRSLTNFLRNVVLAETEGHVVMFIDEIDATLSLDFTDDFFAAIRAMYNARAEDPEFKRLNFMFFGVAMPSDLIKDRTRAPFNIGQGIDLDDFSRDDTRALQHGLEDVYPEHGEAIFSRIYYWTNGHPYLTQKLCLAAAEAGSDSWTDERVDRLVESLFFSEAARKEPNLQFIRDSVAANPYRKGLLTLYRKVHTGKKVQEDERSFAQNQLKLVGLVRVENGELKVRNEVYRQAFNIDWAKANMPVDWTRRIAIGLGIVILLLVAIIGYNAFQQREIAEQAQIYTDSFRANEDPNMRLTNLAGLFDLPGFDEQARKLFFEELTPEQRLDLFASANPETVGTQLSTAVGGLYTRLENDQRGNELLQTMVVPLEEVNDARAEKLAGEIKQWLQGRTAYNDGEYEQAVTIYSLIIDLSNDQNPGVYYDRGLAFTELGEAEDALADFEVVVNRDPTRVNRVQQIITANPTLYDNIIANSADFPAVAVLIPTPTNTPTPTPSDTVTPTPTNTPTNTPIPTNTSTSTPTPVPDAIVVSDTGLNLRSGPGTIYPVIGRIFTGESLGIRGRIADNEWVQVASDSLGLGWVSVGPDILQINIDIDTIPVVVVPPTPTPTTLSQAEASTSIPTDTPTPPPTSTSTPVPATVVFVQSNFDAHALGLIASSGAPINENLHLFAAAPAWSPDGRTIAFFGENDISSLGGIYAQGSGIWLLNVQTGQLRLLFQIDHIRNMNWSPDGSRLAIEYGPPSVTHEIYIIDAVEGRELVRFPGEQPAWSPSGQELVVKQCAPECGLWRVGFDGSGGTLLTRDSTDSYPSWSPTGDYLVFSSRFRDGDWEIYRLDLATDEIVRLTNQPGSDTTPVFSPDGLEVYYRSDAATGGQWQIRVMAIDGSNDRAIKGNVGPSDDWGLARPAVR